MTAGQELLDWSGVGIAGFFYHKGHRGSRRVGSWK